MQLSELLLHESDSKQLLALIASDVQSVLLNSERGYGKHTIAVAMANEIANKKQEYILTIAAADSSITIEQIRGLKSFFTLKTHSREDKRVALIVDADMMTVEAQNSLLKLLEEPPEQCMLLLTSSHPELLLPTISSRVQTIHLRIQTLEQVSDYFVKKGFSSLEVAKVLAITSGLAGLTTAMLNSDGGPQVASLEQAKLLLGSKHLERLKAVDGLAKDRQSTLMLLDSFKTISVASIRANAKGTQLWRTLLEVSSIAEQQLAQNANAKLVLTNLFLSL